MNLAEQWAELQTASVDDADTPVETARLKGSFYAGAAAAIDFILKNDAAGFQRGSFLIPTSVFQDAIDEIATYVADRAAVRSAQS